MGTHILAIDQGTTSSRAIIFDSAFRPIATDQQEFTQHFPRSGWVEHDPEDIWRTTVETCQGAMTKAGLTAVDIASIGITNQRETTVVWDRTSGKAIHNAIVWQDRRTAEVCAHLKAAGHEATVSEKTGLLLDPYFSGTKVAWILDNVDGAREAAEQGRLAFGTIDCFLLWRLTGGKVHATDATNASRTLLYDIRENRWRGSLLDLLRVPQSVLPEVKDSAADYGVTDPDIFGGPIKICGIAGDQQAAAIGQACFSPGMIKSTYGTGCFALVNTGDECIQSKNRLLTTIAYRLGGNTAYALEGSIFIAGAAVQWLRDGLGIIENAAETGPLATDADPAQDVILVPAFAGLGAPYWEPNVRGAMFGLSRGTGPKEISRAALEAVCYQTRDLVEAMRADWGARGNTPVLRVDGGMVASDWTMQSLANILNTPIDRPTVLETTALGTAWLAGMHCGVWPGQQGFAEQWQLERRFKPDLDDQTREKKYAAWKDAVASLINHQRMSEANLGKS